jgi:hypothetical protein
VCFVNSYATRRHESPSPNLLAIVYPNGEVMLNQRVRVRVCFDLYRFLQQQRTAFLFTNKQIPKHPKHTQVQGPCAINLANFPMDSQTCELLLESYSYHRGEIVVEWMRVNPVNFDTNKNFSDYRVPEFAFENFSIFSKQVRVCVCGILNTHYRNNTLLACGINWRCSCTLNACSDSICCR